MWNLCLSFYDVNGFGSFHDLFRFFKMAIVQILMMMNLEVFSLELMSEEMRFLICLKT